MNSTPRNENRMVYLAYKIFTLNEFIPPITLVSIGVLTSLFHGWIQGPWNTSESICIHPTAIIYYGDIQRLFLGPLEHGNDLHLYYNMGSLFLKGSTLERKMGSLKFGILLIFLTGFSSLIYTVLSYLLALSVPELSDLMTTCTIGFSAVLFALKVLLEPSEGSSFSLMSELLLNEILIPGSSFLGQLSGILAGLLVRRFFRIVDFLLWFLDKPLLALIAVSLCVLQFGTFEKPWPRTSFWWMNPSSHDVCLNSYYVVDKHQFFRLISAPLEHASGFHFGFSLLSLLLKLYALETSRTSSKTLMYLFLSILITSLSYLLLLTFLSFMNLSLTDECVQGLSGAAFGLKVLVFYSAYNDNSFSFGCLFFENVELLLLFDERNRLFHISGLLTGLLLLLVIIYFRWPGLSVPESWGYGGRTMSARHMREESSNNSSSFRYDYSRTPEENFEEIRRRRLKRLDG